MVCLVIVLKFLYSQQPRSATSLLHSRQRLIGKQWKVIRHWEDLAAAWFVSELGPEDMSRTATKVETLEETLQALLKQAHFRHGHSERYFAPRASPDKPGDPQRMRGSDLWLNAPSDGMTTFKPVDASRLTFAGLPKFDPWPFLDPEGRGIFEDPLGCRMATEDFTGPKPKLRVHCSRTEKVKLFDLLDSTSRLRLHKLTPQFGSGLFAVTKDLERDSWTPGGRTSWKSFQRDGSSAWPVLTPC